MRPAWLPSQPVASPRSERDGRPRSAASRPHSPAGPSSSPPRDAMVQSARQLLHAPGTPEAPTPQQSADDGFVSLRDFMDSFPLVPLAIIPRLRLADLLECETGLVALYKSLAIDTNSDDAQLGKYVARQLGLVQRHIEQARARERVLKLLNGEEPVALASISSSTSVSDNNNNSTKTLPVFLQPSSPVQPISKAAPMPSAKLPQPVALAPAKSTSSLPVTRRTTDPPQSQLSKAKAIAKATVTTAFVITTSENSLKARQRKAKKKTKQQIEEETAKRQEREKDKRRQAAYQRLMARQALQATKREEARNKRKLKEAVPTTPGGGFVQVTQSVSAADNEAASVDSSSSSDESEVSNCSDNDEANEKAILDMPVVIKIEEEEGDRDPEQNGDANNLTAYAASKEPEDDHSDEEEEDQANEDDERIEGEPERVVPEQVQSPGQDNCDRVSDEHPKIDESNEDQVNRGLEGDVDSDRVVQELSSMTKDPTQAAEDVVMPESDEAQEERARAEIALQLQRFVAERTQSALVELRTRHDEAQQQQQATARSSRPASRSHVAPNQEPISLPQDDDGIEVAYVAVEPPPRPPTALATQSIPPSPTKKRPLPRAAQKKTAGSASTASLAVPRPVGRDVPDYRSYFANFFCILTSVYEQRLAFQAGSIAGGSTSNSSLLTTASISATAAHASDQALRLQLKLYQSWETIMNDYATVFGNSIPTPDRFSSASSTVASPYTAHYRINSQSRKEVSDIVVTALERLGDWDEHPSGLGLKTTWNLLWTWSKPNVERKTLLAWQKVNHFQHAKALTRKDCLKKNIGKYQAMGGRLKQAYDIVPASFLLPQEYVAFVQAFQERAKSVSPGKNIWIMKPVALSRGRGISLVNALSDVVYGEQVVIQEYIANPLLLDGFKFDLRLYVLVTSFNPLEVFFYEEGFVRMCTRAYEDGDLSNLFIHLTNSSIQKENQDAIAANPENPINSAQQDAEAGGTKMTLAYLWKRLEAMGADVPTVKNDILTVILKALICGEDHIPFQVNSFDLYGYDILLDTDFRPWLIEINSSPSMARENELDFQVKDALIYDTLRLVNPLHFDRTKLVEVIARRFHDAEVDKKRSHANTRHPKEAEALAVRQLNEDLTDILRGHVPRAYGEMPEHLGSYTRLAPHTTIHNQLMKLKKSCLRLDRK